MPRRNFPGAHAPMLPVLSMLPCSHVAPHDPMFTCCIPCHPHVSHAHMLHVMLGTRSTRANPCHSCYYVECRIPLLCLKLSQCFNPCCPMFIEIPMFCLMFPCAHPCYHVVGSASESDPSSSLSESTIMPPSAAVDPPSPNALLNFACA